MRKIIGFIFTVMVIGACTSIDCPVQNKVSTIYYLKKANGSTDTLTVDTLTILTKTIDKGDTVTLLNSTTGVTYFDISISYTQPEDMLYFILCDTLGNTYRDTVRVEKENYQHFESVDCQPAYFHHLTNVSTTHHIIDSIVISKSTVNYDDKDEHFHIYFKARY